MNNTLQALLQCTCTYRDINQYHKPLRPHVPANTIVYDPFSSIHKPQQCYGIRILINQSTIWNAKIEAKIMHKTIAALICSDQPSCSLHTRAWKSIRFYVAMVADIHCISTNSNQGIEPRATTNYYHQCYDHHCLTGELQLPVATYMYMIVQSLA